MGSLFKSKSTQSTTSSVQTPKSYQASLDDLMKRFKSAADIPFQGYNKDRVEDLSGREQEAFGRIDNMQDKYNPLIQLAMSSALEEGYGPEDVDTFINPYTQYVINNSKERFQEDYDKQLVGARGDAARSGSFGNSRLGLVEGTLGSEFLKGSRELQYGGLRDAFDRAMSNMLGFNQDRRQSISSLLNTAQTGQNLDYKNIDALAGAGRQERAIGQAGKDFDFQEFMRQIQDPQQKTSFLSQGVFNYPRELFTRNQTTTNTQSMSPFQGIAGLASIAAAPFTGGTSLLSSLGNLFSNPTAGAASGPPTNILPQQYYPAPAAPQGAWANGTPLLYAKGGLIKGYAEGGKVRNLLDVISQAESNYEGDSYETAFGGPKKYRKLTGGKPLTDLTVDELLKLQPKLTKKVGSSASGRYQIMNSTLKDLKKSMNLKGNEKFDNVLQDKMAVELLKRRGLTDFLSGEMSPEEFQDNIALEWAGLPNSKGKSPYKGVGLNKGPTIKKNLVADALNAIKGNSVKELAKGATKGISSGLQNLLLALNAENAQEPQGDEVNNELYADAGEMESNPISQFFLPKGFDRAGSFENANFGVDLDNLMQPSIPAELLENTTDVAGDVSRERNLLNSQQASRDVVRKMTEAKKAIEALSSGNYAPEEKPLLEQIVKEGVGRSEEPKFFKNIDLEKYTENPLMQLAMENPSVMGNQLYNLREKEEPVDGYSGGGTVMGKQYYNLSSENDPLEDDILAIMGNQFYNYKGDDTEAPYSTNRRDYEDNFQIPEKRPSLMDMLRIPTKVPALAEKETSLGVSPDKFIRYGIDQVFKNPFWNLAVPARGKTPTAGIVRSEGKPSGDQDVAQSFPRSVEMPINRNNINFLKEFSEGASGSPADNKYSQTVDRSIENLMKMAGVQPPKEEEPDTIFGLPYNKDLMRFGLALLAAGPGKPGAQAIGEAGQALLSAKEKDRAMKKAREQEPMKQLSERLALLTQGQNLENIDPDRQLATLEKRIGLQSDAALKLARMKAELRTKSDKERVDLIKSLISSGDPMGQKLAKEFLGVKEDADPEQGIEDIE